MDYKPSKYALSGCSYSFHSVCSASLRYIYNNRMKISFYFLSKRSVQLLDMKLRVFVEWLWEEITRQSYTLATIAPNSHTMYYTTIKEMYSTSQVYLLKVLKHFFFVSCSISILVIHINWNWSLQTFLDLIIWRINRYNGWVVFQVRRQTAKISWLRVRACVVR